MQTQRLQTHESAVEVQPDPVLAGKTQGGGRDMSGGSLGYFYSDLESHVGDFKDKELDDLVADLSKLFHDREWFLSCDTNEGTWNEARDAFKKKWFTPDGRKLRVKQYLDEIREDVLKQFGLSEKYCMNCANWTPDENVAHYGDCSEITGCLMHRMESCNLFKAKG